MNKKFQKMLSVVLPAFLFANNVSFARENKELWLIPATSIPILSIPVIAYLLKKENITLDSYVNKNLVYSPLSLKAALIMAANGTSNPEVRKNVADYVGFESLEDANNWLKKIMDTKIDGVNIANSMWYTNTLRNCDIDKSKYNNFKNFITSNLKAECDSIDVSNGHERINNWISQKTENKIPSIFDKLDPETLLVLVNTIYFNSKFVDKFEYTGSIEFNGIDKKTENVPTIKDEDGDSRSCDYCATNDYQAVRIPFEKNGCYLYMVLPKTNNEFDKVKNVDVKELAKNMKTKNVHLEIPRFKIESSLTLNDYCNSNNLLQALMNAKLDNIHPLAKISKIVQKVVFEITPEGVEAAAASGDEAVKECYTLPTKPNVNMIFDHTFIVFITDKDNNVLFKVNIKNIDEVGKKSIKSEHNDETYDELKAVVKTDS